MNITKQLIAMSKFAMYGFFVQLFFCGLLLANESKAQRESIYEVSVSVQFENAPLRAVLSHLEKTTKFNFSFNTGVVAPRRQITIQQTGTLAEVLAELSRQSGLAFKRVNNNIHVIYAEQPGNAVVSEELSAAEAPELVVSGTVTDGDTGEPLPGVSVLVKGTTTGTATDVNGKYSLNAPENATLIFSFISYKPQEVPVGTRTVIDVALAADIEQLQEVVVVGYGTQRRREITGSVSSVSESEIKAVPVVSLDQALQGRVAGMQVTQNSGAPGASISVRVRGISNIRGTNSEPLYVVDGVPIVNDNGAPSIATYGGGAGTVQSNPLNGINPADIESIEVLKDASATAIYGSRGANGVVIITTKRGKAGGTKITLDGYYGVQQVNRQIALLNAGQFAQIANEAAANAGQTLPFTQTNFGEGTNWQDEIFRAAPIQSYNIGASGGDDKTRFALTGGYFRQDGNISGANLERLSFRVNLDREISRKVRIGNSLTASRWVENIRPTDRPQDPVFSTAISSALRMSPTLPVRNPDGSYSRNTSIAGLANIENPSVLTNELFLENTSFRVVGNIFAEWDIIEGLTFKSNFGGDFMYAKENNYWNRNTIRGGGATQGWGEIGRTDNEVWLVENTLNYTRRFAEKHSLNLLAGQMVQSSYTQRNRAEATGFPAGDFTRNYSLWLARTPLGGFGDVLEWGIISYLARVNYSYMDKYLLTGTVRVDGSSRFGADNRYGTFPSISAGWLLSEENFLSSVEAVNELKLRASYGVTGNQEAPIFDRFPLMDGASYSFGNQLSIGQYARSVRNNTFRWQSTHQFDVGLEGALFNRRLSFNLDYYISDSRDLWVSADLPFTSGYPNIPSLNSASMRNTGIELTFNATPFDLPSGIRWNTSLNISTIRNLVTDLGAASGTTLIEGERALFTGFAFGGTASQIIREGSTFPTFYGFRTNGIFQNQSEVDASAQRTGAQSGGVNGLFANAAPGDFRVVDINGNGIIDAGDRTQLGSAIPDFYGGLTNTFSYKGLELSIFLQFSVGNEVINANKFQIESFNGSGNQSANVLNRWTASNPSNTYPRVTNAARPFMEQLSDRVVEDGSFLRARNITLAYNLPKGVTDRIGASGLRVYVSAQNLFLITKYSGYDPELTSFRATNNTNMGIDFGGHPIPRVFMGGFSLAF